LNVIVVSPDVGGVSRARAFAKSLGGDSSLVIIDKRRQSHNQAEVLEVIRDVAGKTALIVDDVIDTAGTFLKLRKRLNNAGRRR
jgi:ribose-phosphate pyrophosphokinase